MQKKSNALPVSNCFNHRKRDVPLTVSRKRKEKLSILFFLFFFSLPIPCDNCEVLWITQQFDVHGNMISNRDACICINGFQINA
jgi:hypothetical protein